MLANTLAKTFIIKLKEFQKQHRSYRLTKEYATGMFESMDQDQKLELLDSIEELHPNKKKFVLDFFSEKLSDNPELEEMMMDADEIEDLIAEKDKMTGKITAHIHSISHYSGFSPESIKIAFTANYEETVDLTTTNIEIILHKMGYEFDFHQRPLELADKMLKSYSFYHSKMVAKSLFTKEINEKEAEFKKKHGINRRSFRATLKNEEQARKLFEVLEIQQILNTASKVPPKGRT